MLVEEIQILRDQPCLIAWLISPQTAQKEVIDSILAKQLTHGRCPALVNRATAVRVEPAFRGQFSHRSSWLGRFDGEEVALPPPVFLRRRGPLSRRYGVGGVNRRVRRSRHDWQGK